MNRSRQINGPILYSMYIILSKYNYFIVKVLKNITNKMYLTIYSHLYSHHGREEIHKIYAQHMIKCLWTHST